MHCSGAIRGWMDGIGWALGGVKYRAPYSAKNSGAWMLLCVNEMTIAIAGQISISPLPTRRQGPHICLELSQRRPWYKHKHLNNLSRLGNVIAVPVLFDFEFRNITHSWG